MEAGLLIGGGIGQSFLPFPEDGFVVGFHVQPELGILFRHSAFLLLRLLCNDIGNSSIGFLWAVLQQKQEVLRILVHGMLHPQPVQEGIQRDTAAEQQKQHSQNGKYDFSLTF